MAKRAASPCERLCPVCSNSFKNSVALEQHLRDKPDATHVQFRSERPAESEQPTAKKARSAFDKIAQTGKKISDYFTNIFPSPSDTGNPAAAASYAKQAPSPPTSRSATPRLSPRLPEKDSNDPESQEIAMHQEQEMQEELKKFEEENKIAKQQVQDLQAKVTELQQESHSITRQKQTSYDQGQRQMQQKLDNAGEEFMKMQKQNEALQKKNNELHETINELRAMSSAATPGNDNINAKFPFKSEIVKSYSKIVKGVLSRLLDPCWDTDDILWACAVSKCIFTACQKCALDSTQKPQRTFQEAVKAGEGADWERTRWEMTKLQRTTRATVLKDFKGNAVESWVQSKRTEANGDVARLLSQKNYKPASLEECMYQLMKVLMDAALDEPPMTVDLNMIKKQTSFDKGRHEVLEGHLKQGEPCIIVFPKLHPHNEAKAYVMPYDQPEEVPDSDDDEPTLTDLEEDDGSAVGGGGGKGRGEAGRYSGVGA